MADQEQQQQQEQVQSKPQKKSFLSNLGLFQKIALIIVFLILVVMAINFLLGGVQNFWQFVFSVFFAILLIVFVYFIIAGIDARFKREYYSPKEDLITKYMNISIALCPKNLGNLYFRGDETKQGVYAGKIIGCLAVPYLIGKQILDDNGSPKTIYSEILKKNIPLFENTVYGTERDTLFLTEIRSGFLGMIRKKFFYRVNRELHTELNADVFIKDINPVPQGAFLIPTKQYQRDPGRMMIQSSLEVIMATFEHQGDLISQSADAGVYFNPYFKALEISRRETDREWLKENQK